MRQYQGRNPAETYRQQLWDIYHDGDDIIVRGRHTKELLDVTTQWTHPRERLQIIPGRRLNPWLALSEAIWTLAGRNDTAALLPYNRRIAEFSDNGSTLSGAYGYRMKDQIMPLIERFQKDPHDRRGVLVIWEPADLEADTVDPPCNDVVMFKVRNELLHMTVMNRSNDLHWGLYAVNQFQFGILQEYIAARLGVGLGNQTHYSQSLHIYMDGPSVAITDRMLAAFDDPIEPVEPKAWHFSNVGGLFTHEHFMALCNGVLSEESKLEGEGHEPFLAFADDFLRFYRVGDHPLSLHDIRYAAHFPDWIALGEEFLQHAAHH